MQQVPPDYFLLDVDDDDNRDPETRVSQADEDRFVEKENEFYADDQDQDNRNTTYETELFQAQAAQGVAVGGTGAAVSSPSSIKASAPSVDTDVVMSEA